MERQQQFLPVTRLITNERKLAPAVRELSWTHHRLIMSCKMGLLIYHRKLRDLVAIELKIERFKPEHLGQLNFYLEALDRDVKKTNENPSIGVLLCKDKDSEVVEYALSRTLSPTMVTEYTTQLPDKKLLQQKLHELFEQNNEF